MRKLIATTAALVAVCGLALAGLDTYQDINYVTLQAPTVATAGQSQAVTNATPVAVNLYKGQATLVIGVDGNASATNIVTLWIQSANVTNSASFANVTGLTWTKTNAAAVYTEKISVDAQKKYLRVVYQIKNGPGAVSCVLVTH